MKALIENTTNLEKIFFPVRLVPTNELTGMNANPKCINTVIATLDGSDHILSTCGEHYNLISNEEVYMPIVDRLKGIDHTVTVRTINNATFEVKFNIKDNNFATNVGTEKNPDIILPQIVVNRSLDSGSMYMVHAGFFRMICSNGLVVPVKNRISYSAKGKHTTESLPVTLKKIMRVIDTILGGGLKEESKVFKVLTDRKVENFADRVEEVMNAAGLTPVKRGETKGKKWENTTNLDEVLATIRKEMIELDVNQCNDWLVYNGINAFIYDEEMNRKPDLVRRDLDQKVMANLLA